MRPQRMKNAAFWLHVLVAVAQNTTSSTSSNAASQQNSGSADISGSDSTIFLTLTSTEFDTVQPSTASPTASSTSYTTVRLSASTSTDGATPVITDAALASAVACNSAKLDWSRAYGQTAISGNTTWSDIYTRTFLSTIRDGFTETLLVGNSSQAYTLCDGWPRVDLSSTYHESTTVSTSLTTVSDYITTSASAYVDPPSCTIAPRECEVLQSSYLAENSTYASYYAAYYSVPVSSRTVTWNTAITSPFPPICGVPTVTSSPPGPWTTLNPAACVSNGATIQLLYWPVETVGDRLCGNYSTIAPTETISGTPNTAEGFNTTFTSPTVYMVFKGAYSVASDYAVGDNYQAILPLSSTAVSSVCGQLDGSFAAPQEVDYADFNSPVPASAYRCQPKCFGHHQQGESVNHNTTGVATNLCSTIYDNYDPALEIPTAAIKSFFTNGLGLQRYGDGQHCSYNPDIPGGIIFDPPKALQQVGSIAAPTKPGGAGPVTTPAAPADSPTTIRGPTRPATAEPTAEPDADNDDVNDNGNNNSSPEAEPADEGNEGPATKPVAMEPTEKPESDNESDEDSDNGNPGADNGGQEGDKSSPIDDSEPTQNIGDIIASGIGMLSPSGSSPTQAPGTAPIGASDAAAGQSSGSGQAGGSGSAVNDSNDETPDSDGANDDQTPEDSNDAASADEDIGAIIVSAADLNSEAAAEATARPNGAATGSGASNDLDIANANEGSSGDSNEGGPTNQASDGSSSSSGAEALQASSGDDVDDGIQVAVITGQNGRVVTATLVSSSIILPQATIAADQGPTDVLGLGRIFANEDLIAVDDGEAVPFISTVNVPAGSDDNDDEDGDESPGVPVLTLGEQPLTLAPASNDNGYVLAGSSTTLTLAGTSAVTLDGTTLALPSAADTAARPPPSIVVNGQTSALATTRSRTPSASNRTGNASASDEASTTPSTTQARTTQTSTSPSSSEGAAGDNGAGSELVPLWTCGALLLALVGVLTS